MEGSKQPLSNADRQKRWRERSKTAEASRLAWIEFLEAELGADRTADLRLRFLASQQLNEN